MSINCPILGIQLFKEIDLGNLRSWPCMRSKFKVTNGSTSYLIKSLSFDVNQSPPTPHPHICNFFKSSPWKSKVKVIAQVIVDSTSDRLTFDSFPSRFRSPDPPIPLQYSFLKLWHWKLIVKVMGEVKVYRNKVCPTSHRFTSLSFHVNRPSHYCDTTFSHLTWKIRVQGHKRTILHNYRFRQFHRTSIGVNPSSGFIDKFYQVWKLNGSWFYKFWSMGMAIWGKWTNYYDVVHLQVWTIL